MLYPCWTCCSHWPKPAPSQTMVSMNHRQSLVSHQSNCQINLEEVWCCLRECCMHMRQHPAKVTHDSPKRLYWAGGSDGLTSFFFFFERVVGSTSPVSHVGGERWPSAVWKRISIDMCWVPAPFYPSQHVLKLPLLHKCALVYLLRQISPAEELAGCNHCTHLSQKSILYCILKHFFIHQPAIHYDRIQVTS